MAHASGDLASLNLASSLYTRFECLYIDRMHKLLVYAFVHIVHLLFVYINVSILYAKKGVFTMIRYKVDVLAKLKEKGYTSYKLRQDKLLGEATLTKLRAGGLPSWHELDMICGLLECQPGDIVERVQE